MAEAATAHPHSADLGPRGRHPCAALRLAPAPKLGAADQGQNTDFDRKVDKWSLLPWPKRKRETLSYVKNSNVIHN